MEICATLSCGVAIYPAHPTVELLVEAADAALYAAEAGGAGTGWSWRKRPRPGRHECRPYKQAPNLPARL